MYCPQCGQERISEMTSFCSRCGYLLTGTAELMKTGGTAIDKSASGAISPRWAGVRQGVFMLMLMFVVAPIIGLISVFGLRMDPWPVGLVIFLLGGGGLLRIVYALLFESRIAGELPPLPAASQSTPPSTFSTAQLPPQQDIPAADYVSPWVSRDPDTVRPTTPGSVTDATTRLLENEPDGSASEPQKENSQT